jgi:hypothetical protein
LQVLKEQVCEFAGLKEILGAKKISRIGSQVTVADYANTFQFTSVAYRHKPEPLCWNLKRIERFKISAKEILLQYIGTMIGQSSNGRKKFKRRKRISTNRKDLEILGRAFFFILVYLI